jgi:DNA-binding PadR family transcriptional regulator
MYRHAHGFLFSWAPEMSGHNALEHLILDYLKEKSGHGSEIAGAISGRFFGCFNPGLEDIHRTLKMLVGMGYVNYSDKDNEKVYTITGEGKEYLQKRQDIFHNFKSRIKDCMGGRDFAVHSGCHHCGMWAWR